MNKLYSQVEAHDQRFPGAGLGLSSQSFGDSFLGQDAAGKTLTSLLESFNHFDLESHHHQQSQVSQVPASSGQTYSGWPAPAQPSMDDSRYLGTKSPMKFPSQVLTQSRASPFSDTTESSLFSNSSVSSFSSRLDLPQPGQQSQFSSFSSSSLLSTVPSVSSGQTNSLGLSDISSRLEELSQGSMNMSQGASTRDSTPLSWNPMINYSSSKTSSMTSSPTMSQSKNFSKPFYKSETEDNQFSEDEDDKLAKMLKNSSQQTMLPPMSNTKPKLLKSMSTTCVPGSPVSGGMVSWSQIVRTSSTKLPSQAQHQNSVSPVSSGPVTRSRLTPSPAGQEKLEQKPRLVVEEVPPTTNTVDYHRGPKVDDRWQVSQQVFLGPIPMSITWDEIRSVFFTKVQRRSELCHFYVQSKPVNEVVYGQVVFDKPALATKVVKDGPVKVRKYFLVKFFQTLILFFLSRLVVI